MIPRWIPELWTKLHRTTTSTLLDVALPETCAGCGQTGQWFCDQCVSLITPDESPGCLRCGRRGSRSVVCGRCDQLFPEKLVRVRAGFSYSGPVRRAIQRFKYHGEFQRGQDLGDRLRAQLEQKKLISNLDLIVPVPLHPRRYRSRGFNQAGILAEVVGGAVGLPVIEALIRVRNTPPQVRLSADDRQENLRDAFALANDDSVDLAGHRVLLIDDVTTTGATFASAARALQAAGVAEIYGCALAREQ